MTDNNLPPDEVNPDNNSDTATPHIPIPTVSNAENTKAKFWAGFFLGIGFAFVVGFGGCLLILSSF